MEKIIKLKVTYDEYITIICALQEYGNGLSNESLKAKAKQTKEKVDDQYFKSFAR
jgi:hypothetical protein